MSPSPATRLPRYLILTTILAAAACRTQAVTPGTVNTVGGSAAVQDFISSWPSKPREVAAEMIVKYGQPAEVTATMLVWHNNGPWKRTILNREEVPHSFPMPHTDLLEQFIDYRVPPGKFDDLAIYDGSVIAERTKGEMSARCDKEEMNFLALNLANDVATGARSADQARAAYAEQAMAFKQHKPAPLTERLRFNVSRGGTGDPDKPTM